MNEKQQNLLSLYGEKQIIYMFEKDEAFISPPPEGSNLVGISIPFGLPTALDTDKKIRYSYRGKAQGWVSATDYKNVSSFDHVDDFKEIYKYLKEK